MLRSVGHSIPVVDPIGATNCVGKLRSVVQREPDKVLYFDIVALNVWCRCGRVTTVARRSGAENTGVGNFRVVEPDDDALPVVSVAAHNVASGGLVLGPVPCVHDTELLLMPGCSGVGLALVGVTASSADIASVLETSTVKQIREFVELGWIYSWAYLVLPASLTAV